VRRLSTLISTVLLVAAAALGTGCGEGGVGSGATVTVYIAAPLCREAETALRKAGGMVGDLRVDAVCLPPVESKGRADLAVAGANARRATEDSASVAFVEAPGPVARFAKPIVESAGIAWVETDSGAIAMRRVLEALEERGSSSPRSAVLDEVG
jgi:hypothetical protein